MIVNYDPRIGLEIASEMAVEGRLFSKLDHIGAVVEDIDKAIAQYQALGIGPFRSVRVGVTDRREYGRPVDTVIRVRVAELGGLWLELIQPVSGQSFHKRSLDSRGEGINHLGFSVSDIDEEETWLAERGLNSDFTARFEGGGGFAYFHTDKVVGLMFELIQWPPGKP